MEQLLDEDDAGKNVKWCVSVYLFGKVVLEEFVMLCCLLAIFFDFF